MPTKISEVLRQLQADGWYLVATRGSHRQFKHPTKQGRVTVAGKPSDDLAPGTLQVSLSRLVSRGSPMRFAIVIEQAGANFSAYVPDLPGCVATGESVQEVEVSIREAISFHLEGLREDGLPVPAPASVVEYVEIAA